MEDKNLKDDNIHINQFDFSFETELKDKIKKTNLLMNLFHNFIVEEFKKSDIYEKIIDEILSIEEDLSKSFTNEQKGLFDKWEKCRDELENYTAEQSFIYGYCFDKEISIEKQYYNKFSRGNKLMDIVNLINQKYSNDVSLVLDNDLLVVQYMYIRGGERDTYKSFEVKEFEDKFHIKFVDDKFEKITTIKEIEDIFEIYKRQICNKELTQLEIKSLKEKYIKGTKIELIKMYDIREVPPKTRGTIDFVDDIGQIHIKWENGSTLTLNVGVDEFKIL